MPVALISLIVCCQLGLFMATILRAAERSRNYRSSANRNAELDIGSGRRILYPCPKTSRIGGGAGRCEMSGPTYGTMTTRYGEIVRVDGSSVSGTCWLRINTAIDKNNHHGGDRKEADALLTLPQAKVLLAVIASFIDEQES